MTQEWLQIIASQLKGDYYAFFRFFWKFISPDKYVDAPHIELICSELDELGHYVINREKPPHDWYIINVPPGTSKSSMVTVLWPAWLLCHDPGIFIINSAYSIGLSERDVRKCRAVINSDVYKALFGPLNFVKATESYFETASAGGRYATSTGGTIVGYHGNVNIHDDPLSVEMSYSPTERERAVRFVTETMAQRVRDKEKTPQVIVMQRLHAEDPTGYIVDRGLNTRHIVLPDVYADHCTHPELYSPTPCGNKILDPQRLPMAVTQKKKRELGEVAYSSQYGQMPISKEGLLYAEFKTYEKLPLIRARGNYTDTADAGDNFLCSVDYAIGKDDGNIYVTGVTYTQSPMEKTEKQVPMMWGRTGTRYAHIESNAGGRYFATKLQENAPNVAVKWFTQSQNKEARILTNAATVNQRIYMPEGWESRWPIFAQHLKAYQRLFKANKYDDAPDVLTGIIEKEIMKKRAKMV